MTSQRLRLVGGSLVAAGLALTPWTLASTPLEDSIIADVQRIAQLTLLQVFLISAGIVSLIGWRPQTALARAAGGALVLGAVIFNPWLVAGALDADGRIDDFGHFALLMACQATSAFLGLALVTGRIRLEREARGATLGAIVVLGLVGAAAGGLYWGTALYSKGHSHTVLIPSELAKVTAEQRQWTLDFYERSLKAALDNGWFDFDTAMAQGFQADPVNRTHFPNPEYMFDDRVLDPEKPEWLVYHDSPDGKVLMALMFFTRELLDEGPTPAGPLALWHYHPYWQPRCAIEEIWTVGKPDESGECAEGELVTRTPEMFHVWFIDHPLSRYTEMKIVPDYWQDVGFDIRWYHPVLVHFTIALFVVAVLLDLAGVVTRRPDLHFVAWVNLLLAAVLTVGTVATGMTAEVLSKPTLEGHWTLDIHKIFAAGTSAVLLVLVVWRAALRGRFPGRGAVLFVLLGLLGVGLVTGAGYYGGEMVYKHGTAVRAISDFTRETYWERIRRDYLPRSREAIERVRVRERTGATQPAGDASS